MMKIKHLLGILEVINPESEIIIDEYGRAFITGIHSVPAPFWDIINIYTRYYNVKYNNIEKAEELTNLSP